MSDYLIIAEICTCCWTVFKQLVTRVELILTSTCY